ncbi:MAG: hypothetical protein ABIP90_00680 [Vicinamibacterales bacterium]
MKHWVTGCLVVVALGGTATAQAPLQQPGPQPTIASIRATAAAGRREEAWAMLDRLPIEISTVEVAVDLALAPRTQVVEASRLPFLADRTARLSLDNAAVDKRLTACVVVVKITSDASCRELLDATTRGDAGTALDRARLWVLRRLLGERPASLPAGWEAEVLGSSALEVATWPELPSASRVRLLEPMATSQDPGKAIAALATLQIIPGPEALALWRRLSTEGGPSYPGARTQIQVGLARHGDPESLKALAPYLGQLSVADRLVLAQGRAERREASGVAELVSIVNIGAEHEAIRAAETLAGIAGAPSVSVRVRTWVRDGSLALRERWLAVAAHLNLGASAEVVRRLTSDDDAVRLAAAVAVAAAASGPARQPSR